MPFSLLSLLLWNQVPVEAITVENMDHLHSYTEDLLHSCPLFTMDDPQLSLYTNFDIFVNGFRLYTVMLTKRAVLDAADAERFVYLFLLLRSLVATGKTRVPTMIGGSS